MIEDELQPSAERGASKQGYPTGKSAGLKMFFDPKTLKPVANAVHEDDM